VIAGETSCMHVLTSKLNIYQLGLQAGWRQISMSLTS
jgi:hypothetical protein